MCFGQVVCTLLATQVVYLFSALSSDLRTELIAAMSVEQVSALLMSAPGELKMEILATLSVELQTAIRSSSEECLEDSQSVGNS